MSSLHDKMLVGSGQWYPQLRRWSERERVREDVKIGFNMSRYEFSTGKQWLSAALLATL